MISGEFSSKIMTYLESQGKTLNESLLAEAKKRLAHSIQRQLMEDNEQTPETLRMSSGGQCTRKQWYRYVDAKGEPFSGRTLNTFLMGDLCEVGLSVLGRLAGMNLMGKPDGEDEVNLVVDGVTIKGHIDDMLQDSDGKLYLMEYKTMSEYSYRAFETEGLDDTWGYMTQSSLYCHALGLTEYIMVGMCKNTGHVCDKIYSKDLSLVEKATGRWHTIINADDKMPERELSAVPETVYNRKTKERDPTGRKILGIVCSYCPFKKNCWPNATEDFKGSKPIWIVGGDMPTTV